MPIERGRRVALLCNNNYQYLASILQKIRRFWSEGHVAGADGVR